LVDVLNTHDSVVIMTAGRARPRILNALATTGRTGDARYLEYIGRDNEMIETAVARLAHEPGPYFSIFVVTRSQRDIR
jgi:precorrin-2/cobalt-factor-2 C20-methyltransferase